MANQLALKLYCRPGDDVIVGIESHAVWHETGAAAAIGGIQFTEVGSGGKFTADEFLAARNPRDHLLYPPTTLVEVEDTHNRCGGLVWDHAELDRIGAAAREHGVASYLDGARLLNAAVARGDHPATLAAPFDLISIALSKGLGCPVGSVLAGRCDDVAALVRYRRMLGGAMRQAGVLAAAGVYALDHHVDRIAEDHARAKRLAEGFAAAGLPVEPDDVETNFVQVDVGPLGLTPAEALERLHQAGVRLSGTVHPTRLRAVTHLDVTDEDIESAIEIAPQALIGRPGKAGTASSGRLRQVGA
jgi:threonine aldolase